MRPPSLLRALHHVAHPAPSPPRGLLPRAPDHYRCRRLSAAPAAGLLGGRVPRGRRRAHVRQGFDEDAESSFVDARFPWERWAARSPAWMAELTLPAAELRRLRHAAMRIKSRTKVGGAGVTREVVEKIRDKWRTEEVVRIKVTGTPALNMRLFHEILEAHGMKSSIKGPPPSPSLLPTDKVIGMQDSNGALVSNTEKEEIVEPAPEIKYEDEIDRLLDELGPQYSDWPRCDPLPVDADLLPATVPGYKPPFRVLTYGI